MRFLKYLPILLMLLLHIKGYAQDFLIENITVFDGENVIQNTSILVKDGEVSNVTADLKFDGDIIDGSGKFLMPGMTNSHVHAWMAGNLVEAAKAGVLNVLDMHGVEQYQQSMRKRFLDSTNYARYWFAGAAATVPNGHGTQYGFTTPTLTEPEEADEFVADRIKAGAHYLKIIVESLRPSLKPETVEALIKSAHAKNLNAVVHVSQMENAEQVLSFGADGLVHVWWDKPFEAKKLKALADRSEFFMVPTLLTVIRIFENNTSMEDVSRLSKEELLGEVLKAYEAGVPILAGTDPPNARINYGSDIYEEMKLLKEAGLSSIDVLKSATSLPAIHFDLPKLGFLKPGYKADMVLLNENPLEDMEHLYTIEAVWKEGKVVKTP
ncbi:amidohydrolase family protein [Flavobacteriaceae bacterium TK19130]|nr:amidohydrolase family protein [Thermobacterium salinum]